MKIYPNISNTYTYYSLLKFLTSLSLVCVFFLCLLTAIMSHTVPQDSNAFLSCNELEEWTYIPSSVSMLPNLGPFPFLLPMKRMSTCRTQFIPVLFYCPLKFLPNDPLSFEFYLVSLPDPIFAHFRFYCPLNMKVWQLLKGYHDKE